MNAIVIGVIVAIAALIVITAAVKIIQQYELGVVFRLGRFAGTRKPGIRLIIPFIDRMNKIDIRVITVDVPSQEVITKDNVTASVNAVVFLRVMNAERAVIEVFDFRKTTFQMAQTTLRSVLGQYSLDELLSERDKLNEKIRSIIDEATDPWGVKVTAVEIKDVILPDNLKRSMAAQAEAERTRRGKVIHAEGEYQAAQRLVDAAEMMSQQPAALQLRYLQTLTDISEEKASTVVFPLPVDLLTPFLEKAKEKK
ncbi:MAG: slipin family protein [Dehalococcoidia bacterium]